MVFSVIGDSDSFVPRPWPTTIFQTALIEAAKSGGGMTIPNRRFLKCFIHNASRPNIMKKKCTEK